MAARKAEVIITCDATTVKQVLEGLNREMEKTNQRRQQLQQKQQAGIRLTKAEEKELQSLIKYENALAERQQKATGEMRKFGEVMKDLAGSKTKDLKRALNEGKRALDNMSARDPNRQRLIDDLRQIQRQIEKNTAGMQKFGATHNAIWQTAVRNITAYMGVFAAFNWVRNKLTDVAKKNLEFSDELTNIRKVSQLTEQDINKLATSLAKIDTRSSVHELNNLAYAGAKLGMQEHGGVAALEAFVKAADKVNVALKEDLGDDALVAMSKLVEVMGLIPKMGIEKSMDAAGSAIFTLSTSSTATGANIIEFSKRLMGLANVSKVTTDQLLALGSASDAMGLMPEVSATAFNKVFTNIQSNTAAIEKSLDMTKGTLQELINDGKTMEAIVTVFNKMHGMSMAELKGRGVFQALGSDGARLNNVMTTMADRIDMLTTHLEMSNKAFAEGTAVQKEYEMQMESAQGYMERAANLWEKAFVNPEGVDVMKDLAKQWYAISDALTHSTFYLSQVKLALMSIVTVCKALIVLAPYIIDFFLMKGAVAGAKYLWQMWKAFVANRAAIIAMTEAQLAANKAMKANVYIALASAVLTLGVYLYDLAHKTDDAEKAQERLNNAISEGVVEAQREVGHLNNVIKALDNAKLSQQGREKVISDFNSRYSKYIDALGIEIKTVDDLRRNYDSLASAIRRAAFERVRDKFKEQELEPLIKTAIEKGADLQTGSSSTVNAIAMHDAEKTVTNFSKAVQTLTAKNLKKFRETYKTELQALGLDSKKATVQQIKTAATPANERKILNRSVQTAPRSLNEYLANLIDKGEITNAVDAYKNIIMKEFSNGAAFGATFDENLNYVTGQRTVNGRKVGSPVIKPTGAIGGEKSAAFNQKLFENIEKFVNAYLAVKIRGEEIDSAFNPYIQEPASLGDNKIKPYQGPEKGGDKGDKKGLKQQFKDAKDQAEGMIAKIDEWYKLQEAAVNDARAAGELNKEDAEKMLQAMQISKNEALAIGRRAVTSGDSKIWDDFKQNELPKMMADAGDYSTNLLHNLQHISVKNLHDMLAKFNGEGVFKGMDASAFFDLMNSKAASNDKAAAAIRAKMMDELEKMFKQYQFVEQAQDKMRADLKTIGFMTETYEQMIERLRTGREKQPTLVGLRTSQREEMVSSYMQRYGTAETPVTDTSDAKQLQQWLDDFTEHGKAEWAIGLPSISDWLKDANGHLPEIKQFYETLRNIQLTAEQRQREGGGKTVEQTTTVQENKTFDTLLGRTITDKEAYNTLGIKFRAQKTLPFTINIENEQEAMEWIKKFATNARGEMEDWVQAFPDLIHWLDLLKKREQALKSGDIIGAKEVQQQIDEAQPKVKSFYYTMIKGEEDYQNAIKKKRDEFSKTNKTRWQTSGNEEYFTQREKQFQGVANEQERRPSVARDLGFQNLMDDGEINMYATKLVEAQAYYDQLAVMKQNDADLDAVLADQEAEIMKQRMALQDKLMEKMNEQAQSFEKLSAPLEDYAETVGNALGRMTEDGFSFSEAMKQANLKVLESFGKLTIDLVKEQITQRIRRLAVQKATDKLMQREQQTHQDVMLTEEQTSDEKRVLIKEAGGQAMAMAEKITGQQIETTQAATNQTTEAAEMADTTAKTNMGIVKGEAKTIGELGWWGIPLAAAIGILLNGLLSWLLGSLGKSNDNETPTTQSSSNATKTKLVSGMLTYDKGNVSQIAESGGIFSGRRKIYDDGTTQVYEPMNRTSGRHPVVGQDGQVYMVHDEPELRTGIIRRPTATTVNGEPAIVGEKGPEIVIGRKTSAAIQKNAPELLQAIADIDRNPNHRPALPVYDKGNVQESVVREMMDNFHKTHTVNNTENTESMTRWFNDFVTTAVVDENGMPKRQPAAFIKAMPQMGQWLEQPENYIQEITKLYTILSNHEDVEKRDMQEKTERTNSVSEQLQTVVDIDRNPNHKPTLPVYDEGNVQVLHSKDISNQNVDIMAENVKKLGPFHSDFIDACKKVNKKESEFTIFKRVAYTPHESPQNTGMLYRVYEILEQKGVVPLISGMNYSQKEISQNDNNVVNSLPAGVNIITEPIATMVNGEPSLVAEKGPEIVIGRETSKAIMMNEPELLQRIVKYDKHGGRAGLTAMRAFDQGNVSTVVPDEVGDVAQPVATPDAPVTSDNSDLRQTMQEMQQVMQGVLYYLKHPVSPEIAMYGENGLHKKMKQADKFMSKYEG